MACGNEGQKADNLNLCQEEVMNKIDRQWATRENPTSGRATIQKHYPSLEEEGRLL